MKKQFKARLKQAKKQKRAAREKQRRKTYKANKVKIDDNRDAVAESVFPLANQLFWLAHGVNCLLSDYKEGTWTPLFERLYDGELPESQEAITSKVMVKYSSFKEWPSEAKAAIAWTVSSPKLLHIYWHEAMRRMQRAHPDLDEPEVEPLIRRPADGCVWDLFHYLKQHLLQRKAI